MELARKHDVVHGEVKSAVYNSQGYSENDPTISFTVTGVNGEEALIGFSHYDQTLLGISFDASVKINDAAMKRILEETEKATSAVQERQPTTGEMPPMIVPS